MKHFKGRLKEPSFLNALFAFKHPVGHLAFSRRHAPRKNHWKQHEECYQPE